MQNNITHIPFDQLTPKARTKINLDKIIELRNKGYNTDHIVLLLNQEGYKTSHGNSFTKSNVEKIITRNNLVNKGL